MRNPLILGVALAVAVSVPTAVPAQEYQSGQLWTVSTWEVNPPDAATLQGVAEKIAKAAELGGLGEEYGWTFWNNVYTYTVVSQFHEGELADPHLWMKQFMGTPGEALLMEAFQDMQNIDFRSGTQELVEVVPGWSYMPEGMSEAAMPGFVEVFDIWVKSGAEEQFDALAKEFMGFFKEMGYKYGIQGHRVRFGDTRTFFVTWYDTEANYFGPNSMDALVEQHYATERWGALLGRMSELTTKASEIHMTFMPGMSYMGPAD